MLNPLRHFPSRSLALEHWKSTKQGNLCGAAAGNSSHRYIGKVCSLLLVRADYIRPRPRARPRGHGEWLKLLRKPTKALMKIDEKDSLMSSIS